MPALVTAQMENAKYSLAERTSSSLHKEEKEEEKNKYTCSYETSRYTSPQRENIRAGKISSSEKRVYFVAPRPQKGVFCPSSHPSCRLQAYLRPSDDVFITHQEGIFACVMHISPFLIDKGRTFSLGWIPLSNVALLQPTLPTQEDWVGTWETGRKNKISSSTILIKSTKNTQEFILKADTLYNPQNGLSPTVGQIDDVVHSKGSLMAMGRGYDGQVDPVEFSDRLPLEEQDCFMRIRMIGKYMVVESTMTCAGLNASFNGVYYRK